MCLRPWIPSHFVWNFSKLSKTISWTLFTMSFSGNFFALQIWCENGNERIKSLIKNTILILFVFVK